MGGRGEAHGAAGPSLESVEVPLYRHHQGRHHISPAHEGNKPQYRLTDHSTKKLLPSIWTDRLLRNLTESFEEATEQDEIQYPIDGPCDITPLMGCHLACSGSQLLAEPIISLDGSLENLAMEANIERIDEDVDEDEPSRLRRLRSLGIGGPREWWWVTSDLV